MTPENHKKIEALLQEVSVILLSENLVRCGGWSFKGWSADGRPIVHKLKVDGYERTGPTVERERLARLTPNVQGEGACPKN